MLHGLSFTFLEPANVVSKQPVSYKTFRCEVLHCLGLSKRCEGNTFIYLYRCIGCERASAAPPVQRESKRSDGKSDSFPRNDSFEQFVLKNRFQNRFRYYFTSESNRAIRWSLKTYPFGPSWRGILYANCTYYCLLGFISVLFYVL